jgi:UDP-N-acetylmuramyl pentapeptide phosphotransferase/UDP-N-acetylglucosamine-1-phosphate transferase
MAGGWAAAVVPVAVLAGTLALTGSVRGWLQRRAILDRPVERSSHAVPVPRGGGLAVMPVLLAGGMALVWAGPTPNGTAATLSLAALLALVSWRDDLGGLPVGLRLLAHAVAALAGVALLPNGAVFQGFLPPLLDRAAAALLWVWFINLFNFMDGIDGITGVETVCLGLGIALVAALAGSGGDGTVALALATAAAGLGFLRWNWHPAQVFLGDVGSVPLGFLLGWLLLLLAAKGLWAPALILPLYYLADATLTLARRIRRGERFWQPHREHFYQRALAPDGDHAAVVRLILAGDLVLLALALLALAMPILALVLALAACALLLLLLDRRAGHGG